MDLHLFEVSDRFQLVPTQSHQLLNQYQSCLYAVYASLMSNYNLVFVRISRDEKIQFQCHSTVKSHVDFLQKIHDLKMNAQGGLMHV